MGQLSLSALAVWVLAFPLPQSDAPSSAPVHMLTKAEQDWVNKKYDEAVKFGRQGKWGYEEAQKLIREIVDFCTRELGKNHFETARYEREIKSLEKLSKLSEVDRLEYMKTYVLYDDMNRYFDAGKYTDALKSVEQMRDIYCRLVGPEAVYVAMADIWCGMLLNTCQRYDDAEKRLREALTIRLKVLGEDHPDTIDAHFHLGNHLSRHGSYAEADGLLRNAMAIAERLLGDRHWKTAVARTNVASLLERKARYDKAEPLYWSALNALLASGGEDGRFVAMTRNNLAVNLCSQAKYAAAEEQSRLALAAQRKLGIKNDTDIALFSGNLGCNLDDQARHTAAEKLHRTALDIWIRAYGESHTYVAQAYSNLAVNLDYQGRYGEGEEYLNKALQVFRAIPKGEESTGAASTYSNLASCLCSQEKYAAGQEAAEKAVAIFGKLLDEDHPSFVAARINLAASLKNQGKYDAAEKLFRDTLSASQKKLGNDHPDTALCQTNLSVNFYYQGHFAEAAPHIQAALDSLRRTVGEGHPRTAWAYKSRIGNYCAMGEYANALALGDPAIASFEAARLRLGFAGLDRALRTEDISPLPGLAVAAARVGKPDLAWQALERNMARGLLDHLAAHTMTPEEQIHEQDLLEKLNQLDRKIDDLRGRKKPTEDERQSLKTAEADRNLALAELVQFQTDLAERHGVTAGKVYQLAQIQKQIPENAALVAWVDLPVVRNWKMPEGDHWACLVKRTGDPIWVSIQGTGPDGAYTNADDQLAPRFRHSINVAHSKEDWKELKTKLVQQRLGPLGKHLQGVQHLIVLPSSDLVGIPLEALTDLTVSYAPSATMFAWLREKRAAAGAKDPLPYLLAFGNPQFKKSDTGPAALPATSAELAGISRLFNLTREFKGPEASELNLERVAAEEGDLRRFPYLHFATHGVLDEQRPMRSALLLAAGAQIDPLKQVLEGKETGDGRLTAEQMLRRWKLDAELVTLSACRTGLGRKAGGDGYLGFSQALFIAGARSMVVSLWEVDDNATSLLMTRFYENMMGIPKDRIGGPVEARSKAEALKEAKEWLQKLRPDEVEQLTDGLSRQGTRLRGRVVKKSADEKPALKYDHPYYWSGFVLVGDPR